MQSGKTVLIFKGNPEGLVVARQIVVKENMAKRSDLKLWHRRLCHVSKPSLAKSSEATCGMQSTLRNEFIDFSECCKLSKATRKPYQTLKHRPVKITIDRVYSDEVGPVETE